MINTKKYQISKSQSKKMDKLMKGFDKGVAQYLNTGVQEKKMIDWTKGEQYTLWFLIKISFAWFIIITTIGAAFLMCMGIVLSGIDFFFYNIGIETHILDYITKNYLDEKTPNPIIILICWFFILSVPGMFIWAYINQCRAKWRIWRNSGE